MTRALLLFLAITSGGLAWSGERKDLPGQERYQQELVFVQKTRNLVGTAHKLRSEAIRGKETLLAIDTIRVWSGKDGRLEDTLHFYPEEKVKSIAGSPTADRIAVALRRLPAKGEKYDHSAIASYSLSEKRWVWRDDWPDPSETAFTVSFSSDGLRVIVIGSKNIFVYDAITGKKLETIGEPLKDYSLNRPMSLRGSVVSPSGRYLVVWQEPPAHYIFTKGTNDWVTIWDLPTRKEVSRWKKLAEESYCAAFTRDEKYVLFGSAKRHITTWSVERGEKVRDWLLDFRGSVADMKFSDDYRYLAVNLVGDDLFIRVYDYAKESEVRSFPKTGAPVLGAPHPMTFFDESDFFAFANRERRQVCVYDTRTWKENWCDPK